RSKISTSIGLFTLPHSTYLSYISSLTINLSCGERPVYFPVVEQTAPVAVMTPSLRDKIFSTSRGTDKLFCKFSYFKISLIRGDCSVVFFLIPHFLFYFLIGKLYINFVLLNLINSLYVYTISIGLIANVSSLIQSRRRDSPKEAQQPSRM